MDYPYEKIREAYNKLPENIKNVFSSDDTDEKIFKISQKYKLHIDEAGGLGKVVSMMMIGFIRPKEFIPELSATLKVDYETATEIAKEVNDQIFSPIREELKKVHGLDGSKPLVEDPVRDREGSQRPSVSNGIDDRLGKYFSPAKSADANVPAPRPYTQDPYREAV